MPFPTDTLSDMITKKGRFGTDPYIIFSTTGRLRLVNSACFARTPSPTDDLSGMDTKRVGLEPTPTIFFSTTGHRGCRPIQN